MRALTDELTRGTEKSIDDYLTDKYMDFETMVTDEKAVFLDALKVMRHLQNPKSINALHYIISNLFLYDIGGGVYLTDEELGKLTPAEWNPVQFAEAIDNELDARLYHISPEDKERGQE